jgi:beta-glucosidase/6-phospho-beta-glucosidase/beta-galactosidase
MAEFMFATGIECSYPTIDGGRWRVDQLESTEHYRYWRRDLELVKELGLRYLRYGPPLHRIFQAPNKYDWSFMDEVAQAMQAMDIVPIIDLCHFGVPDWIGDFQNTDFPQRLSEYARAFAQRYRWVQFYTPVNEMYVTARLSALDGLWNEQLKSEEAYVRATSNLAKASILTMKAIREERSDAIFVNSESSEFHQACCPDPEIRRIADFENQRRFIALDLLFAVPVRADVYGHLIDHGMSREEYEWFMNESVSSRAVLGVDYYKWNEKLINSEGKPEVLGELFGWYVITNQYYERYKLPVMHTETNCPDANEAPG